MIVAGFGFRSTARPDSLQDAYDKARQEFQADLLAAPADKTTTRPFVEFSRDRALPIQPIGPNALKQVKTITNSLASRRIRHTGSVAEASALAAAGPNARLLASRSISSDRLATCALAIGDDT